MSPNKNNRLYSSESSDEDYDDDAECGKYTVGGVTYARDLEYRHAQVDDYKKVVKSLEIQIRVLQHSDR